MMLNRLFLALAILVVAWTCAWAQGQINTPGQPVMAGFAHRVTSVPTIQAAAYTSGNCIGGFNAITVANYNGQTGFIVGSRVTLLSGLSAPTISVAYFSAQPTASTCTDRSTFTLAAADVSKLIDVPQSVSLATPTGYTQNYGKINYSPPQPFTSGGSTTSLVLTIYYALVSGSSFTPTSTTDIQLTTSILLNQ